MAFKITGALNKIYNAYHVNKILNNANFAFVKGLDDDVIELANQGLARCTAVCGKKKVENVKLDLFFGKKVEMFLSLKDSSLAAKLDDLAEVKTEIGQKISTLKKLLHCKQIAIKRDENILNDLVAQFNEKKVDMKERTRDLASKSIREMKAQFDNAAGKDYTEIIKLENQLEELKELAKKK